MMVKDLVNQSTDVRKELRRVGEVELVCESVGPGALMAREGANDGEDFSIREWRSERGELIWGKRALEGEARMGEGGNGVRPVVQRRIKVRGMLKHL